MARRSRAAWGTKWDGRVRSRGKTCANSAVSAGSVGSGIAYGDVLHLGPLQSPRLPTSIPLRNFWSLLGRPGTRQDSYLYALGTSLHAFCRSSKPLWCLLCILPSSQSLLAALSGPLGHLYRCLSFSGLQAYYLCFLGGSLVIWVSSAGSAALAKPPKFGGECGLRFPTEIRMDTTNLQVLE